MPKTAGGQWPSSGAKIRVAVFAGSWYRSYVPLFLYSLFKTYPDYEAVVFLRKPLGHVERPGMRMIRGMGQYHLAHNARLDVYPKLKNRDGRVKLFQALRFLALTPDNVGRYFSNCDYVYLTDVDILILPEPMPLAEQHIRHSEALNLPYSNFVRNSNPLRLTGLHFAQSEFYRFVAPTVQKYATLVQQIGLHKLEGLGRCPDEALWYRIVQESGLPLPPACPWEEKQTWQWAFDPDNYSNTWFGPHHGIHVGFGRCMRRFRPIFKTKTYRRYLAALERYSREDGRLKKLCDRLHPRAKAALDAIKDETGLRI